MENEEISAKSIQSPHDTDCDYRDKKGNKKKGYSINLTETCDGNDDEDKPNKPVLNLITDVQVEVASTADNNFLEKAVEETEKILSRPVERIHAIAEEKGWTVYK